MVVCSAYLLYVSEDPPPLREFDEIWHYCEVENLYLAIGRDSKLYGVRKQQLQL